MFEAAPRDRQVPVRRRRPESEPDPEPPPAPLRSAKRLAFALVTGVIAVMVITAADVSHRTARDRAQRSELDRQLAPDREAHRRELDTLLQELARVGSTIPTCATLAKRLGALPRCPTVEEHLSGTVEAALGGLGSANTAGVCEAALAALDDGAADLRCQ